MYVELYVIVTQIQSINKWQNVSVLQILTWLFVWWITVFLGGSCNPTKWRAEIAIPYFKQHGITFYNPVRNVHTLTICTYNTHLQYTLTIYACTKSLYTVHRLAMKYWLFYKKTLFGWQWSTGYFIKSIIWLAMKYWVFYKKHCSVGNEVLGIL